MREASQQNVIAFAARTTIASFTVRC